MLPVLVGAARLVQAACEAGAKAIVYDTTGLIDPAQGGAHLKLAKINLLGPRVVFAIQYGRELEYMLRPLRRSRRVQIIDIRPSPAAQSRDMPSRRFYRVEKFAQHFAQSQSVTLNWNRLAVFPAPDFSPNRLVALENGDGFVLGLGIVTEIALESREVTLLTPLGSIDEVDAIHLGDVELDPETFRDLHISKRD
jgi:polynucleotide 5'-kinase involved in rRNA processing